VTAMNRITNTIIHNGASVRYNLSGYCVARCQTQDENGSCVVCKVLWYLLECVPINLPHASQYLGTLDGIYCVSTLVYPAEPPPPRRPRG
jgi:hypothetical protein